MRSEENKERFGQVHAGSVHPGNKNSTLPQPLETGESLWILCRSRALLYVDWVYGGGISILPDEESEEIWIKIGPWQNLWDLWGD